jgi:hypothetical protein
MKECWIKEIDVKKRRERHSGCIKTSRVRLDGGDATKTKVTGSSPHRRYGGEQEEGKRKKKGKKETRF